MEPTNNIPQHSGAFAVAARAAVETALTEAGYPPATNGQPGPVSFWDKQHQVVAVVYSDGFTGQDDPPAGFQWDIAQALKAAGFEVSAGVDDDTEVWAGCEHLPEPPDSEAHNA